MPELPEVETVRRGLEARVLGRRIVAVEVSHPQVIVGSLERFERDARGRIRRLDRKGKAIAVELRSGTDGAKSARYLLVRLGMTGQVTVVPREYPVEAHTHVRLKLENGEEIRYRDVRRFGRLRCCTPRELESIFSGLGPDAPAMTADEFLTALESRRTPIKSWLLNQSRLSGVGNIYADEALFEAHIHPLTEAGRLSRREAIALHRSVEKVLRRAIALQGTTLRDYIDIEGKPGRFQATLKVYQRTGEPCRRCHSKIRRLVIGGRSSHFCPRCQPRSRPSRPRSRSTS
jgi:formamidopyrimidine-DNA glycosylase